MYILGLMFAPLESLTSDAANINDTYLTAIEAGIKNGKYPAGLQKQYAIQLERIKKQQPSCEILVFPGMSAPGRMFMLLSCP